MLDVFPHFPAARGVDALPNLYGGEIIADEYGLRAGGEGSEWFHRLRGGFRRLFQGFLQGPDVVRRGAAAAAHEGYPRLCIGRSVGGKGLGVQGEMGFPVFQYRHAGIGLDDDGLIGDRHHLLCCVQQLVRAHGAVGADHVGSHGVQENGGGHGVGARDGAAVFAVGHLADYREGGSGLRSNEGRLHFLDVDDGLDDEAVRPRIGKGPGQAVIILAGLIEGQVPDGADKFPRRAHVSGHLHLIPAGLPYVGHGGGSDFLHLILEVIVLELQGRGAEGIRGDVLAPGVHVGPMDLLHHLGMGNIVIVRAAPGFQTKFLKHGTHAAIK